MEEISKKELLAETGISYGQLYRWKREGLIPEEWFVKRSSFTGQETFFPRERILERVKAILAMKDGWSLEEIRRELVGEEDSALEGLIREAIGAVIRDGESSAQAIVFETNDGKHYMLLTKDGRVLADGNVKALAVLSEKAVRERIKAFGETNKR
jgi:DNA-binding transcriptional MerR regulator